MTELVRVPYRFRGLEDVALGGYVCGRLAREVGSAAAVSLRRPPPLERELELVAVGGGRVELRDGEIVVAEGAPTELDVEPPAPIAVETASTATGGFAYAARHPRPSCVVCSPARTDGLGIVPGPLAGSEVVAAVWEPDQSLPTEDGAVAVEVVWSALDCPTYFGGAPAGGIDSVLARLAARLFAPVRVGHRYSVASWPISIEGRKRLAGVALWSADGETCALGHGLWVERRAAAAG